jgi:hypothetical protein
MDAKNSTDLYWGFSKKKCEKLWGFRKITVRYEHFLACKRVCMYVGSLGRRGKSLMVVRTLHKYEPKKGREKEADQSAYPRKPML